MSQEALDTSSAVELEDPIVSEPLMLRTENLVKRYGKRTVVSNVSINVKQGEIVGLMGPNGAGRPRPLHGQVGLIVPNEDRFLSVMRTSPVTRCIRGRRRGWLPGAGGFDLSQNVGRRQYPVGAGVHRSVSQAAEEKLEC